MFWLLLTAHKKILSFWFGLENMTLPEIRIVKKKIAYQVGIIVNYWSPNIWYYLFLQILFSFLYCDFKTAWCRLHRRVLLTSLFTNRTDCFYRRSTLVSQTRASGKIAFTELKWVKSINFEFLGYQTCFIIIRDSVLLYFSEKFFYYVLLGSWVKFKICHENVGKKIIFKVKMITK